MTSSDISCRRRPFADAGAMGESSLMTPDESYMYRFSIET